VKVIGAGNASGGGGKSSSGVCCGTMGGSGLGMIIAVGSAVGLGGRPEVVIRV
jgi:hypothetical protein